jgi:hypothetical protein
MNLDELIILVRLLLGQPSTQWIVIVFCLFLILKIKFKLELKSQDQAISKVLQKRRKGTKGKRQ